MSPKRMTRSEKQEQTRSLLLEAANSEIAKRGFGAITIEEITQLSGLTRGAFYSNFSNKNELFLYLLRCKLREASKLFPEKLTCGAPPSNEDPANVRCDVESVIVWIEAILHAWRNLGFRDSFATLFVPDESQCDDLRARYKNGAKLETTTLAREIVASAKSSVDDAFHITINFAANLDSKQGNEKLSMLFTLSLSDQDTHRK